MTVIDRIIVGRAVHGVFALAMVVVGPVERAAAIGALVVLSGGA